MGTGNRYYVFILTERLDEMRYVIAIIQIYFSIYFISIPACYSDEKLPASFTLTLGKEVAFAVTCISIQLAGNYFLSNMTVPDPIKLKRNDVNSFDRFACKYYSKKVSYLSDNTKDATTLILALSLLPHLQKLNRKNVKNLISDIILFLEAETLIAGMTKCAKGLSERPRPYVYNSDLPIGKRQRKASFESFWSGHTSLAFTTAVFTGYVFQNRYPESRFIKPIWLTGVTLATATGMLRVRSGNHFPSDVVVSAAVGSFVGWIVPWMHKERESRFRCEFAINEEKLPIFFITYN